MQLTCKRSMYGNTTDDATMGLAELDGGGGVLEIPITEELAGLCKSRRAFVIPALIAEWIMFKIESKEV